MGEVPGEVACQGTEVYRMLHLLFPFPSPFLYRTDASPSPRCLSRKFDVRRATLEIGSLNPLLLLNGASGAGRGVPHAVANAGGRCTPLLADRKQLCMPIQEYRVRVATLFNPVLEYSFPFFTTIFRITYSKESRSKLFRSSTLPFVPKLLTSKRNILV